MKTLSLIMLMLAAAVLGQDAPPTTQPLTPEQAMQRLKERQAARDAARNEKVTITRGELDDLRAEVAALKAEIAKLQAAVAAVPPANPDQPRFILKVSTGTTRAQLVTFIAMHKDHYQIAKDVRSPDKQELITLEKFRTEDVFAGNSTNGVNTFKDYKKEKKVFASWDLVLINDVITGIGGSDRLID